MVTNIEEPGPALADGPPAPGAPHLRRGDRVDCFEVIRLIGRGGNGEVHLARDLVLGRRVALKLIRSQQVESSDAIAQFLFEAKATAQFSHPNIVTIYAAGEHDGLPYLALEYIDGQSLRERLSSERPSAKEGLRIALAIAEAMRVAHEAGILHRDLKPENVLLAKDGRPRVVDFGLAKALDVVRRKDETPLATARRTSRELSAKPPSPRPTNDAAAGTPARSSPVSDVSGTPAYMAPEQWLGEPCREPADVWALGVMLFELLTGARPYQAFEESLVGIGMRVTSRDPAPALKGASDVGPEIAALVDRCLVKAPGERPSVTEIIELLSRATQPAPAALGLEQGESPFRGLLPFAERHADLFFGRDAEIAAFLERLRQEPILTVAGPSGAGKSSFVQAGIIARLREQQPWTVLRLRPGHDPFYALAARLLDRGWRRQRTSSGRTTPEPPAPVERPGDDAAVSVEEPEHGAIEDRAAVDALAAQLEATPRRLAAELWKIAREEGAHVLLFVDQLEELHALGASPATRAAFMTAIATAAEAAEEPVRVILTVRDDFLGRVAEGKEAQDALSRIILLRSPPPEALHEILTKPLDATGFRFEEPRIPDAMLAEVSLEPACLPILQFAARALWDARDRDKKVLLRSAYAAMGGVTGALATHADSVLDTFSTAELQTARVILLRLVTAEKTRRSLAKSAVTEGLGEDADAVLRRLIDARLLSVRRVRSEREESVIELAHESLIRSWARLARWIDETHEDRALLDELIEAAALWERRGRRDEESWHGDALRDGLRAVERSRALVPEAAKTFLEAGKRRQAQAQRRRSVRIQAGSGLLVGLALVGLTAAWAYRTKASEASAHSDQAKRRWAEAELEGARAAFAADSSVEARAKLRGALEIMDSEEARVLWLEIERSRVAFTLPLRPTALAFSGDGRTLAVAGETVSLIDTATMRIRTLPEVKPGLLGLSSDGRLLVVGDGVGGVQLIDVESGAARRLRAHAQRIFSVTFSLDGRRVVTTSRGSVRITDVASGKEEIEIRDHAERVYVAELSPDGNTLLTVSYDQTVRTFDAHTGRPLRILAREPMPFLGGSLSHDGKRAVAATAGGSLVVTDVATGKELARRSGVEREIDSALFDPQDRFVIYLGLDGWIRLWEPSSGRARVWSRASSSGGPRLVATRDGRLIAGATDNGHLIVWNGPKGFDAEASERPVEGVTAVALDVDHNVLAVAAGKRIAFWDPSRGEEIDALDPQSAVANLRISPDGTTLASSGVEGSIRIWDVASRSLRHLLLGHKRVARGLAFTTDGRHLVSGSNDWTARMWNVATGSEERRFTGHTAGIWGVALRPDGRQLATSAADQTIRLHDVASGASLRVLSGHRDQVKDLEYDRSGKALFSNSDDGTIRRWELSTGTGEILSSLSSSAPFALFSRGADRVAVVEDASGTPPILWDRASGARVRLADRAILMLLSEDGTRAIAATRFGSIRLYDTTSGRALWNAPLLLASPPELATHRGWIRLDAAEAPVDRSRWRTAVIERANLASAAAGRASMCMVTFDAKIERWDLTADVAKFSEPFEGARAIVATPDGCAVLGPHALRFFAESGASKDLFPEADAIALDGSRIAAAVGAQISALDPSTGSSAPLASVTLETGHHVSAISVSDGAVLIGTDQGSVYETDARSKRGRRLIPPPSTETPEVTALAARGGLAVSGHLDGSVALWSLSSGARLFRTRLARPVRHLLIAEDKLYAATDVGERVVIDLRPLRADYCALVREVWAKVPFTWTGGEFQPRDVPADHRCAGGPR